MLYGKLLNPDYPYAYELVVNANDSTKVDFFNNTGVLETWSLSKFILIDEFEYENLKKRNNISIKMKQYKHKVTGEIAKEVSNTETSRWYSLNGSEVVPSRLIENSSDWEELKPSIKFKILEFQDKYSTYTRINDSEFSGGGSHTTLSEKGLLFNSDAKVSKVLRLSDNQQFSIGDKTSEGTILAFKYKGDELGFLITDTIPLEWLDLSSVELSKPLFTTEDGVKVFAGDDVYIVHTPLKDTVKLLDDLELPFKIPKSWTPQIYQKTFVAKALANEFILMNKPGFSIQDILNLNEHHSILNLKSNDIDSIINLLKEVLKRKTMIN